MAEPSDFSSPAASASTTARLAHTRVPLWLVLLVVVLLLALLGWQRVAFLRQRTPPLIQGEWDEDSAMAEGPGHSSKQGVHVAVRFRPVAGRHNVVDDLVDRRSALLGPPPANSEAGGPGRGT